MLLQLYFSIPKISLNYQCVSLKRLAKSLINKWTFSVLSWKRLAIDDYTFT